MSINETKWTFLVIVCVPLKDTLSFLPLLPLHLESTLLGVKDLFFILLGFPKQAPLRDRSPDLSEPIVTLGFPISIFCLCVHLPHKCAHPRFAEQNNIWSLDVSPSISYSPSFRVTRRILSHRYAMSLDETACACFLLGKKKIW